MPADQSAIDRLFVRFSTYWRPRRAAIMRAMRTIRVSDPFPPGKPQRKLEWGTSAWAADSCLVEWSKLEREWLGPVPTPRPPRRRLGYEIPLAFWLTLLAFGLALTWMIVG
jgi:hypothetical protein